MIHVDMLSCKTNPFPSVFLLAIKIDISPCDNGQESKCKEEGEV